MDDPGVRAAAVANGMIWYAPMSAQEKAVDDVAAGRIERPSPAALTTWPDWAINTLAYYDGLSS